MEALMVRHDQANGLGEFPKRLDTVRATVLARMLRGELMTAMDGVFDASTTRLASDVHVLRRKLGWGVITDEVQVPTADGRMAEVARYRMPAEVIALALAAGAEKFIAGALTASADRRNHSCGQGDGRQRRG